jgi:hypothetical protein
LCFATRSLAAIRSSSSTCLRSRLSSKNRSRSVRDDGSVVVHGLDPLRGPEPVVIFYCCYLDKTNPRWPKNDQVRGLAGGPGHGNNVRRVDHYVTTLNQRQCNKSRSLRLMSALRVNSGTCCSHAPDLLPPRPNSQTPPLVFPKEARPPAISARLGGGRVERSSKTILLICIIVEASEQSALLGAGSNPAATFREYPVPW